MRHEVAGLLGNLNVIYGQLVVRGQYLDGEVGRCGCDEIYNHEMMTLVICRNIHRIFEVSK